MYVDITRGRNRNIAIATEQTLPDDQPHLPNAEPDLEHRITSTLERAKERTAYELDPQALDRSRSVIELAQLPIHSLSSSFRR